jgi:delta 1-pyrroline-5-carboxylate dehydrogenase
MHCCIDPKASGPHYLARLAMEQTVSVNTAAAEGNAALTAVLDLGANFSRQLTSDSIQCQTHWAYRKVTGQ